jgi:hypothetical protein
MLMQRVRRLAYRACGGRGRFSGRFSRELGGARTCDQRICKRRIAVVRILARITLCCIRIRFATPSVETERFRASPSHTRSTKDDSSALPSAPRASNEDSTRLVLSGRPTELLCPQDRAPPRRRLAPTDLQSMPTVCGRSSKPVFVLAESVGESRFFCAAGYLGAE